MYPTDTDTDAAQIQMQLQLQQTDADRERETDRQGGTQCRPTLSTNKLIFLFVFVFNCNERRSVKEFMCNI